MKIKINDRSLVALQEIKKNVDELLDMNLNEMDFTEENLKRAKEISERLYNLGRSTFMVGGLSLILETSDGTKLTVM